MKNIICRLTVTNWFRDRYWWQSNISNFPNEGKIWVNWLSLTIILTIFTMFYLHWEKLMNYIVTNTTLVIGLLLVSDMLYNFLNIEIFEHIALYLKRCQRYSSLTLGVVLKHNFINITIYVFKMYLKPFSQWNIYNREKTFQI